MKSRTGNQGKEIGEDSEIGVKQEVENGEWNVRKGGRRSR